ncbi:MAG: iron-sulfur cluster assembly scaffold protein [Candidatus Woesearchaeota archaeon]|nr:iron-sulfur cluster assembly scaffold protein [Candidatus Woesearchaeota archaeon]
MTEYKYVDGEKIDPNEIESQELTEEQRIYKENILDHYRNPRNKKKIEGACYAHDKNPFCGDEIDAYVVVDGEKVVDVGFQGNGCAISQASMSMITRKCKGKTRDEINALGQDFVLELLGIPIGVVRRKCAMLGLRVIQQALEEK